MDTKEKKLNDQTDGVGSDLVRLFLMFMLISFIGWCMETVYVLLRFGHLSDRGFLSMPFCPIYGFSILAIYLLIGTPQGGVLQPLFAKAKGLPLPARAAAYAGLYLLYFLAAALIPTAAEFLTGLFFDKLFGIRLWDYTDRPFNILGYVCLPMSALWGGADHGGDGAFVDAFGKTVGAHPAAGGKGRCLYIGGAAADRLLRQLHLPVRDGRALLSVLNGARI